MKINIKTLMIAIVLTAMTVLTGCNTVAGMGTDIQQGGRAVTHAAYEVAH